MTPEPATEEDLLRRWRDSDSAEERRALLERILDPYLGHVARWAQRFSRDPDEARDVAQEALLAVCSHLDRFRGEARFSTWLYTLVRNHALKRARRAATRSETPLDGLPPSAGTENPGAAYHRSLEMESARQIIASELTPIEARVFLLHFGLDVPLAVLDRELRLSNPSGARAYLVSAKRKLRRTIERRALRARARLERDSDPMRRTKGRS